MSTDVSKDFLTLIDSIASGLNSDANYVNSEYITKFYQRRDIVRASLDSIMNINRCLKIGVVGEVKAGKSSFLNALLFGGESILPKAATPMTAALTMLSYSPEKSAKVEFYSDYDWELIENYSRKYDEEFAKLCAARHENCKKSGTHHSSYKQELKTIDEDERKFIELQISPQYRACKELTDMVRTKELNVQEYLNTSPELHLSNLQTYVGTDGKFTPLVKKIELRLDNELIKDLEIYDTPGLNDPILSRSDATKQFLVNCDLVFLLSYSGQFLNNEDINFISQTLPTEGIQNAVLVGSKFDSAILDYPSKRGVITPFKEALKSTRFKLSEQAKKNLDECSKNQGANKTELFSKLKSSLPPSYVSSLMYSAAKKLDQNQILSEEEELIIGNLQRRFSGFQFNSEFLYDFSNINNLKNCFEKIASEKTKIIEEKSRNAIKTERSAFLGLLEDINIQANQNLVDIQRYDKAKLEEKLTLLESGINSMRRQIKTIFETCAVKTRRYINSISVDIKDNVKNHTSIQTITRQEDEDYSRTEGGISIFGKNIFGTKKYYTRTDTIHSASVHDVLTNIREYIISAEKTINNDLVKAINILEIKQQVKACVLQAFDLSDTNFDQNDIIAPLELVLQKITLPPVPIKTETYNEELLRTFSGSYVEGNEIHTLHIKQEQMLQRIMFDICDTLQKTGDSIESILNEQAATFVDDVNAHLSANIEVLKKHLQDKEESIVNFNNIINSTKNWKNQLRSFGDNLS